MTWLGFLFVQVSPQEVLAAPGDTVYLEVRVATPAGEVKDFKFTGRVIPRARGKLVGNAFIAERPGPGVIVIEVRRGGDRGVASVPVRVSKRLRSLSPAEVTLKPGEKVEFWGPEGEWFVVPPWLGEVVDGVFLAKRPGQGYVFVRTQRGAARARVQVLGEARPEPKKPEEVLLFPGERVGGFSGFSVDPPRIARVEGDYLVALRPGNAMAWRGEERVFVRVLPAIFLKPGEEKTVWVPRRARPRVKGDAITLKRLRGPWVKVKAEKEGWGWIEFKKGRRSRYSPFAVARRLVSIGPKELRLKPGESFRLNPPPGVKLFSVPSEALEISGNQVKVRNYFGEAWVVGFGSGAAGFVHLIITR